MATFVGSPDDLDTETRKKLEEEYGELPEKLTLKVRRYFTCYLCCKREYMDSYNLKKGEEPVKIIIDRRIYRICKLCTTMMAMIKK